MRQRGDGLSVYVFGFLPAQQPFKPGAAPNRRIRMRRKTLLQTGPVVGVLRQELVVVNRFTSNLHGYVRHYLEVINFWSIQPNIMPTFAFIVDTILSTRD